jgi:hypothetical protein
MKINLLDIHKQLLFEVAHTNKIEKLIFDKLVPLTPTMVNLIIGNKRINTFHITGISDIDNLYRLQNKRNQISTFNYFSKNTEFHPNITKFSGGGLVFKLSGKINFVSSTDIFSKVDNSLNRRWVASGFISRKLNNEILDNFNFKDIKETPNEKLKRYLNFIYEFIKNNKEDVNKSFYEFIMDNYALHHYNEIIVSHISLLKVAFVKSIFLNDYNMSHKDIDDLYQKLLTIFQPKDIFVFENTEDLYQWFLQEGGNTNIVDFRKNYNNL